MKIIHYSMAVIIGVLGILVLLNAAYAQEPLYVGGTIPDHILTVCKHRTDADAILGAFKQNGLQAATALAGHKAQFGLCPLTMGEWVIKESLKTEIHGSLSLTLIRVQNKDNGVDLYTFSALPVLNGRPI